MERQEFERLALEHLDAVHRLAFHLTHNPEQAEDLVQEVYLRALRPEAVDRFEDRGVDGVGGMRSWLFTICHNAFYSNTKRARRAPQAVEDFYSEAAPDLPPGEAPPAWDTASLDWEHVDGRLREAIEELKPEFREVLLYWGVEGLKYREIANILDVPIGTVMSRLHRARKLVADAIGADPQAVAELGLDRRRDEGFEKRGRTDDDGLDAE